MCSRSPTAWRRKSRPSASTTSTANAFEEDKQKAVRAGMNAHISKPIEADKLMETLSGILQ